MVASGSLSDESISHDCAATGRALKHQECGDARDTARPKGRALRVRKRRAFISVSVGPSFGPADLLSLFGNANT
jgi:hypothetical protein